MAFIKFEIDVLLVRKLREECNKYIENIAISAIHCDRLVNVGFFDVVVVDHQFIEINLVARYF